jgi:hypothetical protein
MSYDIFFVRRDPGQTFEDALDGVEDSYEGGDPGPLTEDDLELWDAVRPRAVEILGPAAEMTQDDDETRELTDPSTGIGLTFFQGEFEIHVPEHRAGSDDLALMGTVYELARAVEQVTGLEGYDPQLGEPVSDTSDSSPTRRRWADDDEDDDDRGPGGSAARPVAGSREPFDPVAPGPERAGRWWEFWKT